MHYFTRSAIASDIPKADGRRLILGWINNWRYAREIPTKPWRDAMTLAREVALRRYPQGIRRDGFS